MSLVASRPLPHPSREAGTHSTPCTPQVLSCSVDWHSNVCPCLEVRRSDRIVSCFLPTALFLLAAVESDRVWAAEAHEAPRRSSLRAAGLVTIGFYLGKPPGGRAAHWDLSTFFQVTRRRRCFLAMVSYPHHIPFPLLACLLCFPFAYLSTFSPRPNQEPPL